MLADQLSNIGAPVSNQRLVLQMIAGLNENCDGVATIIQQANPLPQFYEARSKLVLEETRKAKRAATNVSTADTALLTSGPHSTDAQAPYPSSSGQSFRNNTGQQPGQNRGHKQGLWSRSPWSWWT